MDLQSTGRRGGIQDVAALVLSSACHVGRRHQRDLGFIAGRASAHNEIHSDTLGGLEPVPSASNTESRGGLGCRV